MIKKLDTIFSQYVRLRDTNVNGYGKCFTCDNEFHYDNLECGHFRHRRHMCTRWEEDNANAQCHECNTSDNMVIYISAMIAKKGDDITNEMVSLSNQACKFTKNELDEIYHSYKIKVKELLIEKMFKINY